MSKQLDGILRRLRVPSDPAPLATPPTKTSLPGGRPPVSSPGIMAVPGYRPYWGKTAEGLKDRSEGKGRGYPYAVAHVIAKQHEAKRERVFADAHKAAAVLVETTRSSWNQGLSEADARAAAFSAAEAAWPAKRRR